MKETQYVNAIAGKIKCSGKKKAEIRKQLLTDIQQRLRQGEALAEIISQMGTPKEIAEGFNESISPKEQKHYAQMKALKIVMITAVILLCLGAFAYWLLPKSRDIEKSGCFNKKQMESAMRETIEFLDAGDYAALQENAVSKMLSVLNEETMTSAKGMLSDDWGERKQFGAAYMAEVVQGNNHFAVGEMTVTYENVSVTYRLTYDEEMRLTGLYIR